MSLQQTITWLIAEYDSADDLQYKLETLEKLRSCGFDTSLLKQ